jgi:hypothetical protein
MVCRKHFQEETTEPQVPPLRCFGAPVGMTKGEGWIFRDEAPAE